MMMEGLTITAAGMGGVFLFLMLLVSVMYGTAAVFRYLGIEDAAPVPAAADDEGARIAAAVAVKIRNG